MNQELNILRSEIIQSEKTQTDLMKWKLVLVSSLSSISLGFFQSNLTFKPQYLICLVPLICAYVDLMYFHLTLRILFIGSFIKELGMRGNHDSDKSAIIEYEMFAERTRKNNNLSLFSLEEFAVQGSSIALSVLVIIFGVITTPLNYNNLMELAPYCIAGFLGILISCFIKYIVENKQRKIQNNVESLFLK